VQGHLLAEARESASEDRQHQQQSQPKGHSSCLQGWLQANMFVMLHSSSFLVAMVCSAANGPYQAWGAALPTIWAHLKYTRPQTDMLSFGSMAAYTAGCYVAGELGDRVFPQNFKRLLGFLLLGACMSFCALCFLVPALSPDPVWPGGFVPVLFLVVLTGCFVGATNPISMELCAELTYPAQEGVSGNFIIFLTQLLSVIALALVPHVDPRATTPAMTGCTVLCGLLLLPVKERYLRSASEQSSKPAVVALLLFIYLFIYMGRLPIHGETSHSRRTCRVKTFVQQF